jgi:hypothetical protein
MNQQPINLSTMDQPNNCDLITQIQITTGNVEKVSRS